MVRNNPVSVLWIITLLPMFFTLAPSVSRAADETDPVASALKTLFSPDRAPPNRTMGLVQRNFLDLVEESKPNLEIALVVDGTSSMEASLDGIKRTLGEMLDDISLYKETNVTYQVVVFRDSGSPDGEVVFPLGKQTFEADRQLLHRAVDSIQPESGAPYFHELIDVGVHTAITELKWSTDADTTRWMLVIGDAPPFDAGFEDEETGARRRFQTHHLAGLAAARGIKINCLLCASRPSEREAYESVLDKTQAFMSELATETGGLMLDLSYQDIRENLVAAAGKPKRRYLKIGEISQQDLDALRQEAEQSMSVLAASQQVSIVVLPHTSFDKMNFDPDRPEVRVAADLRQRLRNIPGVYVASSHDVIKRFRRLRTSGVEDREVLQMIATSMHADYVVWGNVTENPQMVRVSTGMYRRLDGTQIAESGLVARAKADTESAVASATTLALNKVVNNISSGPLTPVKTLFAQAQQREQAGQVLVTHVSNNTTVHNALTTGYEALEQATAFEAGAQEAQGLLETARQNLTLAIQQDSREALPYLMLSSCLYNEALQAVRRGDDGTAREKFSEAKRNLYEAKRNLVQSSLSPSLKLEIEADYELLGRGDAKKAIPLYQQLTEQSSVDTTVISSHAALRAHWMLAGIHSGDWGQGDYLDSQAARNHLAQILAHWPESAEAQYVKSKLRWDPQQGKSRFQHMPEDNQPLVELFP